MSDSNPTEPSSDADGPAPAPTASEIYGETYLSIVWRQFTKNKMAFYSLMILPILFLIAIFAPLIASNHPLTYYDGQLVQFTDEISGHWAIENEGGEDEVEEQFALFSVKGVSPTVKLAAKAEIEVDGTTHELVIVPEKGDRSPSRYRSEDADLIAALERQAEHQISATVTIEDQVLSSPVGTRISPWLRWLFNQAEIHDYVFNMSMLAFFPALVISVLWGTISRFARGKTIGIFFVTFLGLTILLSILFLLPGIHPEDRYGQRTFTTEEFENPHQHGVYTIIPFGPRDDADTPSNKKPPGYTKPANEAADTNDTYPHILGTDPTGLDVLTRLIYGTRVALTVGFVAVSLYITIGVILGAIAGYFGGWVDILISRAIEVMMLFPAFFLILTLVALIGPNIYVIMVVFGLTGWPRIARLIRGEVLKQRNIDYVASSKSLGASNTRIIFRHIIPNSLSPALVSAPFGIASAVVTEAGLSLLGFGLASPSPSWGVLLNQGNQEFSLWWLIVFPSIAIFITVTVFNLIGNGLRDAMDPRLRV